MRSLTVQEKIVLHLSQFPSYEGKITVPSAITQEGIADSIGVQRPHISVEIKRMMKKGLINEFKAHAGGRKRRKAYNLTPEGQKKYEDIIEKIRNKRVTVKLDGFERDMKGDEAADYISAMTHLPYAIAVEIVMEKDRITPEVVEAKKEEIEREIYSSPLPEVPELLGREEEIERMERWYRSRSLCLSVVGTAGIGKTALVASFVSKLRSPVFWHNIGEWDTIHSLLADLADFLHRNGITGLKEYLSTSKVDLGMIGRVLQNIDGREIWVFDDYQKAPESMKNLFEMFFHVLKNTPVRLIVISRSIPSFYSRRDVSIKREVQEIFLDGLSPEAARELLVRKGLYPGEEKFREVYAFTGGHPLTLELLSLSGLKKTGVRAYLTEEFYHRLKPAERRMLSEISVHRKPVLPEAFIRIEKDVETLKSLLKKGIIYYDSEEKYFTHDVIKSFFREKGAQKREHLLAYKYYREIPEMREKIEATYHALMAEEYEKAAEIAMEIADEAIIKGMANDLLSALNVKTYENPYLKMVKARAMQATGNFKDAEKALKSLIKVTEGEDKVRAMGTLSLVYVNSGEVEKAIELLEKALEEAKSKECIADIRYNLGMAYIRMGEYERAGEELFRAVEMYEDMGDTVKKERIRAQYASALAGKGDYQLAISILKRSAEFFEERKDYRVLGNIYHNLGTYQAKLGMMAEARDSFEKAALYGEISGHLQLLAYSLMNSANNYLYMGDITKALAMAEKAERIMDRIGDKRGLAILKTVIAEAHEIMGDDAEKYYRDAEKALMELGLKKHLGELYMERGDICKDREKSMEYFQKAMEIFKEIGFEAGIKAIKEKTDGRIS